MRRTGYGRRSAGPGTNRPRADLPAAAGTGGGSAGRDTDLEQPGMNGFPILTMLTVLPVVGAVIALVSGKHARAVAMITALISMAVSLVVWTRMPANGNMRLAEVKQWAPSL